ncbi:hypothetical protein NPA31_007370 [Aurantimonas sp. MSK8Z-1]|uniref:hypothetical protein n=1 Tax=Mangrovibrevibacter kandeliae TaxID=2968473 RepID=UPI0021198705|nr:hypothetical protein [Aurantimonas sp. MSK8Z-1]MCW4114781.1 hypothetical protein [Aurantimonas sp. MSK8Z-1]
MSTIDATDPLSRPYQQRVGDWLIACFGETIARDRVERNHRFLEEALETVQAGGCTRSEAHQLVDYVFGREIGDLHQEVGGVMNTLAALCLAYGIDIAEAAETELARVWTKVEKIRAKQAAKPKHSPLPEHVQTPAPDPRVAELEAEVERLRAALHLAVSRGCDHCADDIRAARSAAGAATVTAGRFMRSAGAD